MLLFLDIYLKWLSSLFHFRQPSEIQHLQYFQAYELSTLTGTQVMLLVASETGHVYTFATRKLQPMITSDAGKALIQVFQAASFRLLLLLLHTFLLLRLKMESSEGGVVPI